MRLVLKEISVSFGENEVLKNINFEVGDTDKVAIIGRNGSGKSTLLRVITGEQEIDAVQGEESNSRIERSGKFNIGYLKQIAFEDDSTTFEAEILKVFQPLLDLKVYIEKIEKDMEAGIPNKEVSNYDDLRLKYELLGGFTYLKEYNLAIKKFGFTESDKLKRLSEFSGGQRTKIALIKLLLSKPDLLILDEPTNHLDIEATMWLEEYLANYKKAVIVVSHDRAFLDKFVNVVYKIERHKIKKYIGNYSDFVTKKAQDFEKAKKDYEAYLTEKNRLQSLADRFRYKATKAKMAQSKLKQIERLGEMETPESADNKVFHFDISPKIESGNDVMQVMDLSVGYDSILSTLNFRVQKGEKYGIVGGNGLGKSTLLKTIVGKIPPLGGKIKFGTNVQIGYFDQQSASSKIADESVLDNYLKEFPENTTTKARTELGAFMFTGDDVFKSLKSLSGGELVRLELLKIFKRQPNFLILDEPTNHMDIAGKEALESMLEKYEGTLLFVSHDRYFINKVATNLIVFENGGAKVLKETKYSTYEKTVKALKAVAEIAPTLAKKHEEVQKPTEKVNLYLANKEKAKKEAKRKKLEREISVLEEKLKALNDDLCDPTVCADYLAVQELERKISEWESELEAKTAEWFELSE